MRRVCPTPALLNVPELQPITGLRLQKLVKLLTLRPACEPEATTCLLNKIEELVLWLEQVKETLFYVCQYMKVVQDSWD